MRILIVDDHPLVTGGFKANFEQQGYTVDIAANYAQAKFYLQNNEYDLCTIDINLPDKMGSDLFIDKDLENKIPEKSIILSGTNDPDEIVMALEKGATGFISKTVDYDSLVQAIQVIKDLTNPVPSLVWDNTKKMFLPINKAFPRGSVLSEKEREVFILMRQGLQDKEIAYKLDRSIHTVRVQIRSIKRKRKTNRRAEVSAA